MNDSKTAGNINKETREAAKGGYVTRDPKKWSPLGHRISWIFIDFDGFWGCGRVWNGLGIALGFIWTNSQPGTSSMSPFQWILRILEVSAAARYWVRTQSDHAGLQQKLPKSAKSFKMDSYLTFRAENWSKWIPKPFPIDFQPSHILKINQNM